MIETEYALGLGVLAALPVTALAALVLWLGMRLRPKHRGWGRARTADTYIPRHLTPYEARHEADVHGPAVLGAHPDGQLALVHADPPAVPTVQVRIEDEITVQVPALIGAAA